MNKRILSLVLLLALVLSLVPVTTIQVQAADTDTYYWPVPACTTISQKFSSGSHNGIDIAGKRGQEIVATKSGTVFMLYSGCKNYSAFGSKGVGCDSAGCSPNCGTYNKNGKKICNWGYGNGLIIKHSDGSGYSMYAHMDSLSVKKGATVTAGQKLGTLGSSGWSTGTHLHFELAKTIRKSGTYYESTSPINNNTSKISYYYGSGSGSTTPTASDYGVTFSQPTDSTYKNKITISDTNATMCNKITKNNGVKVTKMGLYLYDANETLIKKFTQDASMVGNSTTTYHTWFDMNDEVGVTLTPGTTYKYKFFGVFNGYEFAGPLYSFTTTGTAPAKSYTCTIHAKFLVTVTKTVTQGQPFGTLPAAEPREGYTFIGYYTDSTGGTLVTEDTIFNGNSDIDLYPRYEKNPEPATFSCVVLLNEYGNAATEMTVTQGEAFGTLPTPYAKEGYTFVGYYTAQSGGTLVTSSTIFNGSSDITLYPRYEKNPEPAQPTFTDVSAGKWYAEPVDWAVENNITTGTSATTFGPNDSCTRAQVVMFLWAANGRPTPKSTINPFSDIKSGKYYYNAVLWAVEQGITGGAGNGTFAPDRTVTRAEFVTMLWNAMDKPSVSVGNPFPDVAAGKWYTTPVLWAYANGITSGMKDGSFGVSEPCTRAQVVTFLHSAYGNS